MKRADLQGLHGRNPSLGTPDLLPTSQVSLSLLYNLHLLLQPSLPYSTLPFLHSFLLLPLQAPYLLKKIPHHVFVLTCPVLHVSPPPFFFHPAPNLPISVLPAWTMAICSRNRTSYHGPGTVVMFYRTVRSSSQCYDHFTNEEIEAQRGEMNIASK